MFSKIGLEFNYFYVLQVLSFTVKVSSNSSQFLDNFKRLTSAFLHSNKKCVVNTKYKIFLQQRGNEDSKHIIIRNGEIVYQTSDHTDLLMTLLEFILEDFIESTKDHLLLHSAVLVKNEKAIVLPADSNSGKSTLSIAMLKDGFKYISDEVGAINIDNLKVSGFPRPIVIKDKTISFFTSLGPEIDYRLYKLKNSRDVQKMHVGIPCGEKIASMKESFPITAIAFPKYSPNGETVLNELNYSLSVFNLMRFSFNHLRLKEIGFKTAAKIAREIKCYSLEIKDLPNACEIINSLFLNRKKESRLRINLSDTILENHH